jgi:hypothetical protein
MVNFCRVFSCLAVLGLALASAFASGADLAGSPWLVYPCLRTSSPPTIDGQLDDAAWQASVPVSGFRYSSSPRLAREQMVMRLLWDREWLYMAVEIEEPTPARMVVTAHGRDAYVFNDDCIEWFVDPGHSHALYYQFGLNPAAAMWDSRTFDNSWDCPWRAAVAVGGTGWCAEVAMPMRELAGGKVDSGDVWGFNLCRERQAGGSRQLINWAEVFGNFHRPEYFGHLLFLSSLEQLTPALLQHVARKVGRPTRVFVADGWWEVNGKPKLLSYQEDLRRVVREQIGGMLREIRDSLQEEQGEQWERYDQWRRRWWEVRADADRALGAQQWAHARVAVEVLEEEVPKLLWEVRLANLLKKL